MSQITFFFGAGAECVYNMPLGAQYTLDTILSKRSKMYDALEKFYESRINESYSNKYRKEVMFQSNSNAFFEIVERALKRCKDFKDNDDEIHKLLEIYSKHQKDTMTEKQKFKEEASNLLESIYKYVYIDIDTDDGLNKRPIDCNVAIDKYKNLINNFSYYGSIEKDFSSIINPVNCGVYRFWRLINYFWSAYFSIVIPVLKLDNDYFKEIANDKYNKILDNLYSVTDKVFSKDFFECHKDKTENDKNYYYILKKYFSNSFAITTNYTPFVENYWGEDCAYLAGSLNLFEIPEKLSIVEAEDIQKKDFVFPFLATQAPVKPIVDAKQIQEYSKSIEKLSESDCLVIIGYSINENDNHINAILRDFIVKNKNKKIIYFEYSKDDIDQVKIHSNICQRLKLYTDIHKDKIIVLHNNGNAKDLCEKLNDLIQS